MTKKEVAKLQKVLSGDYQYGEGLYKPVLLICKGELKIGLVSKQSGELLGVKIDIKDVLHE